MQITHSEFKSYRAVCAEIADIKSQLDARYAGDTVQSGSKHPYSVHNVRIEGYVPDGNTLSLLVRLSDLERLRTAVEDFVDGISDSEIRTIVSLRYIRGKRRPSWQCIATRLGYCSEHTPTRKLQKYFLNGGNGGFPVL